MTAEWLHAFPRYAWKDSNYVNLHRVAPVLNLNNENTDYAKSLMFAAFPLAFLSVSCLLMLLMVPLLYACSCCLGCCRRRKGEDEDGYDDLISEKKCGCLFFIVLVCVGACITAVVCIGVTGGGVVEISDAAVTTMEGINGKLHVVYDGAITYVKTYKDFINVTDAQLDAIDSILKSADELLGVAHTGQTRVDEYTDLYKLLAPLLVILLTLFSLCVFSAVCVCTKKRSGFQCCAIEVGALALGVALVVAGVHVSASLVAADGCVELETNGRGSLEESVRGLIQCPSEANVTSDIDSLLVQGAQAIARVEEMIRNHPNDTSLPILKEQMETATTVLQDGRSTIISVVGCTFVREFFEGQKHVACTEILEAVTTTWIALLALVVFLALAVMLQAVDFVVMPWAECSPAARKRRAARASYQPLGAASRLTINGRSSWGQVRTSQTINDDDTMSESGRLLAEGDQVAEEEKTAGPAQQPASSV